MAQTVTINGQSFNFPVTNEEDWGVEVTNWAVAVSQHLLQKTGGTFQLSAEVDFGATYGLKSAYFKSRTTNAASAGPIRLANNEGVTWRNAANSGDLTLKANASDVIEFAGVALVDLSSTQTLTNKTLTSPTITTATLSVNDNAFTIQDNSDTTKKVQFEAVGISTGTTRTMSFPDNNDTLVGTTATQTLQNKTLSNPNINFGTFRDGVDTTKRMAFQLTGITAGNTRTLVVPDESGTLVLESRAQTLTNKTIVATDNTISNIMNSHISASAAIAYSKLSLAASIVNADIAASAAIAYSKLSLSNSVVTGDIAAASKSGSGSRLVTDTSPTLTTPVIDDYVDVNEESAPSTPSSGKVRVYAKTDKKLYLKTSDGTETAVGSGAGEKNYIAGSSTASGWNNVGDLDVATTTTAAELPREYTTGSGIKITADANTQSTADYVYYDFTLDDVDLSKKLKIQWSQKTTGTYNAGDLAVIITSQADRTTALHTPVTTAIPAADGVFTTSFDSSTTATLSLVIRCTTDMTTNGGIVISDVVVGPGTQPQGAVVGEWTSFTPPWSANTGTRSTDAAFYRRVGDSMEIKLRAVFSGAGSNGSTFYFTLPNSLTFNTSKLPDGSNPTSGQAGIFGSGVWVDSGTSFKSIGVAYNDTTSQVAFAQATADSTGFLIANAIASGDAINAHMLIPISQWAGSGTLNVAQNDYECYYNSDVSATAAVPSGSVQGNAGINFSSSWSVGTEYSRRIALISPLQSDEVLVLRVIDSNGIHHDAVNLGIPLQYTQGTKEYGYRITAADSTKLNFSVVFLNGGSQATSGTYAQNGAAWSSLSTSKWYVMRRKVNAAVGFGLATSSQSGLVTLPNGMVESYTGNGHGSTNNKIRRFSSNTTTGTAITCSGDDATNGTSYTINEAGIYSVDYTDASTAGSVHFGISVNSNQLTTGLSAITQSHRKAMTETAGANFYGHAAATMRLSAGDVVRPHTNGSPNSTTVAMFRITQICKL